MVDRKQLYPSTKMVIDLGNSCEFVSHDCMLAVCFFVVTRSSRKQPFGRHRGPTQVDAFQPNNRVCIIVFDVLT